MTAQRLPRYLRVLASLRGDAVGGTFQHRLPAEPELARRYGVSRTTLRRAIAALIEEGVLEARHGAGTFIRPEGGRTRTVGLVVAQGMDATPDDPYFQQLANALLRAFARHGWTLRLAQSTEDMCLRLAAGRGASVSACVAAFYGRGHEGSARLAAMPVPLVLVDSEPLAQAPCILADNAGGMRRAVARLVELGHRDIVHLAGPEWSPAGRERLAAFREGMAAAGLAAREPLLRQGHSDRAHGHAGMAQCWAAGRPTAAVCYNDLMALGVLDWLLEHGLRPGVDVSVVGCDDILAAALARPALATTALDFAAHADAVVAAVLDQVPGVRRTPVRLVERATLGPPGGALALGA